MVAFDGQSPGTSVVIPVGSPLAVHVPWTDFDSSPVRVGPFPGKCTPKSAYGAQPMQCDFDET